MSFKVYAAADAPLDGLRHERVAVLGYGNLGRAAALNLRDSGAKVSIGNREDAYADRARADGFTVLPLAEAAALDIVVVLLPDEVIPAVYAREIRPGLRSRGAVAFASGYCLAFGLIEPPPDVDVVLVAPRSPGSVARSRYVTGKGFWGYVSVEADRSGRARDRLLALAGALGILRAGAIEMSARQEALLDLFVEQSVGAVVGMAVMVAFEVGCEAGIPPEAMVMEMYASGEMESVFASFRETGFLRASEEHGPTALFGGMMRTLEMDRDAMTARFRTILEDIQSGGFARRFQAEASDGYPMLTMAQEMMRGDSPITAAEDRVRTLDNRQGQTHRSASSSTRE